jgi:hypothetical protein
MALDGINSDALDRFDAANPLRGATARDLDASPFARALRRAVLQLPRAPRPWWRRFVIPAAIVVALGAGYTVYTVFKRPVTYAAAAGCYSAPNLGARYFVFTGTNANAVASCATLWRSGELGSARKPLLEECVNAHGAALVFPSSDPTLCQRLKLSEPAGKPNVASPQLAVENKLQSELKTAVGASRCLPATSLTATVRSDLQALGLQHWHVVVAHTFSHALPCAGVGVLSELHTVRIIPEPPR